MEDVFKRSGKRKSDPEGEGPSRKTRRRTDLKDTKKETRVSVDALRGQQEVINVEINTHMISVLVS